jgi:hypothetical protein
VSTKANVKIKLRQCQNKARTTAKKEPASYWSDRRHIEQFEVRVQSVRTIEGEALTLLRILDPKMIDIYGWGDAEGVEARPRTFRDPL